MPLFYANYRDKELKQTWQVPVVSVNLDTKKALILHGKRELIIVDISELTWDRWE